MTTEHIQVPYSLIKRYPTDRTFRTVCEKIRNVYIYVVRLKLLTTCFIERDVSLSLLHDGHHVQSVPLIF